MVTSRANAPHYQWGKDCNGWHLLQSDALSIIEESMPPGSSEQLHYHEKAQQVFYILNGIAHFEIEGAQYTVGKGESIHIGQGLKHRVLNNTNETLSFVLVSQPKAHGDRIDV